MKKRIVKLTESDLRRIVKRVIKEQNVNAINQINSALGSIPDNETTELWEETKNSLDDLHDQLEVMIDRVVSKYPEKRNESEKALKRIDVYFDNIKNLKYDKFDNLGSWGRLFSPQIGKGYEKFTGSLVQQIFGEISNTLGRDFEMTEENLYDIKSHIDQSTKYLKGLKFI